MKNVNRALSRMVTRMPLHAQFLLRYPVKELPGIGTAGVGLDRRRRMPVILVDPEFMEPLSEEECMFVLAHEVEHLMRQHVYDRMEGKDKWLWNLATDYVINSALVSYDLPSPVPIHDVLKDRQLPMGACVGCPGGSVRLIEEEVYKQLLEDPPQSEGGVGGFDDHDLWGEIDALPEGERQEVRRRMEAVARAAWQAAPEKARGNAPAALRRLIESKVEAKVPWQQLLSRVVAEVSAGIEDWRYSRPNLPALARDCSVIMPGRVHYGVNRLAFVVDTSGSMGSHELGQAAAELATLAKLRSFNEVVLIEVDMEVHASEALRPEQLAERCQQIEFRGGGGTAMQPGLDAAYEAKVGLTVVFTDGYCEDHVQEHGPTVWLTTTGKAPQGVRSIRVEV